MQSSPQLFANNQPETPLDYLVIAPHPDDAELGMAGAILKLKSEGKRVGVLELTNGEPTPFGTVEKRKKETDEATEILNLDWRGNLGLTNRTLLPDLESRKILASAFRILRPKTAFAPYWIDAHPDHRAATQLIEDARFWAKLTKTEMSSDPLPPPRLYYYYCIHLRQTVTPAFILDITPFWAKKLASIKAFHSQFIEGRKETAPMFLEQLTSEASYWGKLIGKRYGEPFASREPLGVGGFSEFL
ncbi:MAG: bacillithiol biosynthesis deacetylase BshB1 [Pirellulaceae bacterium]|nr:bacillithiol biosynthesis deacetylase BshB1 [Pirellulaceae bacterium]